MSTEPSLLYHPYCHLLNGERLHYILIKTRVVSAQIRNTIAGVIKAKIGEGFSRTVCFHQVFGETDLILRIWASKSNIQKLLHGLREKEEVEKVQTLLIRTMRTWYQTEIEIQPEWNNENIGAQFENIANHKGMDSFAHVDTEDLGELEVTDTQSSSDCPAVKSKLNKGKEDIRFFIRCEQPYETRVSAFHLCRETLDKWLKNNPYGEKKLLQKLSLYGYSTRNSQGVLVKGDFRATKYSESSRALTNFVNKLIEAGLTTTTFIVSETIHDRREDIIEKRGRQGSGSWQHIVSNLMTSLESHPEYYLSAQELAMEGPAILSETKEDQIKRGEQLDSYIEREKLLSSLQVYHADWWETLEETRLLYRWVIAGPPKNEQLIAVMMKGYADMEAELGRMLTNCVTSFSFFEVKKKKLFHELSNGPLKGMPPDTISAVVNHVHQERVGDTLTLEPICIELGKLKSHPSFKTMSSSMQKVWGTFLLALSHGSKDRNDLVHGNESNMFVDVKQTHDVSDDNVVMGWTRYVVNFMHIRILYPMVRSILSDLKSN